MDTIFFSDAEMEIMNYCKDGLIWIIEGNRYRLKEATATGYVFAKLK